MSSSEGTIRVSTALPTEPPPSCTPEVALASPSRARSRTAPAAACRDRAPCASGRRARFRSSLVRSSRLPTRTSAASPGSASEITNVIIEITSSTPIERDDRGQEAHLQRAAGSRELPAAVVASVIVLAASVGPGAAHGGYAKYGTVEALVAEHRRVDALQVLRRDVLVGGDHRVVHRRLAQHQPLDRLQRGAYCASFADENARLYAASSGGIAPFGYFGGFLSSVAFIM